MGQIVHQILSIKYDIKVPSQICKKMNVDRHIWKVSEIGYMSNIQDK